MFNSDVKENDFNRAPPLDRDTILIGRVAQLLRLTGYKVSSNFKYGSNGDDKVDIYAENENGKKIIVECRSSRRLVERVDVSIFRYKVEDINPDEAWYVTICDFDTSARELCKKSGILPINGHDLEELEDKVVKDLTSRKVENKVEKKSPSIEDVKVRYEDQLKKLPNVIHVDTGEKEGKKTIKVLVTRKIQESELKPPEIIPKTLKGYETDVEEIDKFKLSVLQSNELQKLARPVPLDIQESTGIDIESLPLFLEERFRLTAETLNLKSLNDDDIGFVAEIGYEVMQTFVDQFQDQKQRAEQRIDKSIRAMKRAFRLLLVMHNIMFYLGVALIVIGVVSAFNGRSFAGITLGGVGLVDIIFYLIKEPIEGIHESTGNLMQLRAAYNSFFMILKQWRPSHHLGLYTGYDDKTRFKSVQQISKDFQQHTEATLDLIQQYCKSDQARKWIEVERNGT